MTNQVEVITDSTGTKAWTVNPLGDKPEMKWTSDPDIRLINQHQYEAKLKSWQQAESKRRCYEVEWELGNTLKLRYSGALVLGKINGFSLKPNTTYIAEIVDENTVRILKEVK